MCLITPFYLSDLSPAKNSTKVKATLCKSGLFPFKNSNQMRHLYKTHGEFNAAFLLNSLAFCSASHGANGQIEDLPKAYL